MDGQLAVLDELRTLAAQGAASRSDEEVPADRWLLRSALQKAIRRGQSERAQRWARGLLEIDADYLWRSLAVIAVEDIGFGDMDLVTYATVATGKTTRRVVGDEQALCTALIRRMCAAPKSRACCELSIAVEMGRPDIIASLAQMSDTDLLRLLQEERNSGRLFAALGLIRGVFRSHRSRSSATRLNAEAAICQRLGDDGLAQRAAIFAFRKPVDSMSMAVMPTVLLTRCCDLEIVDERPTWPVTAMIGDIPAEAFDQHTRLGQRAIKALWTSLAARHVWMAAIQSERRVRALGAAVFLEEGGLVDRRVTNSALELLQEQQDTALMSTSGVPPDLHVRFRELVRLETRRLHNKRLWSSPASYSA